MPLLQGGTQEKECVQSVQAIPQTGELAEVVLKEHEIMARRRKKGRRYGRKSKKVSILETAGFGIAAVQGYDRLKNHTAAGPEAKLKGAVGLLTGVYISADNQITFDPGSLKYVVLPAVGGVVAAKVVRKVPFINRVWSRMPFGLGKYVRW